MNLLIAEPDSITALMLRRIFSDLGYSVRMASSPSSIPELLEKERFDIIIMAAPMAEHPGNAFINEIEEKCAIMGTGIILLSTWSTRRTGSPVRNPGPVNVIPKPFLYRDIVETVTAIVDDEQAAS